MVPMSANPPRFGVVGAGTAGRATPRRLTELGSPVTVLDKEDRVAAHQTGHNSGVVHAGLYYEPGSLKARLCREGKEQLEKFAAEHGIAITHCGKLVIALDESELGRFDALHERARANGVPGLEVVGRDGIRE